MFCEIFKSETYSRFGTLFHFSTYYAWHFKQFYRFDKKTYHFIMSQNAFFLYQVYQSLFIRIGNGDKFVDFTADTVGDRCHWFWCMDFHHIWFHVHHVFVFVWSNVVKISTYLISKGLKMRCLKWNNCAWVQ